MNRIFNVVEIPTEPKTDRSRLKTPSVLDIPSWNGKPHTFSHYKHMIEDMRQQMSPKDHPITVSRLVPKLSGPAEEAITRTHVDLSIYSTQTGMYEFLPVLVSAGQVIPYHPLLLPLLAMFRVMVCFCLPPVAFQSPLSLPY